VVDRVEVLAAVHGEKLDLLLLGLPSATRLTGAEVGLALKWWVLYFDLADREPAEGGSWGETIVHLTLRGLRPRGEAWLDGTRCTGHALLLRVVVELRLLL
jgi:hypothetical protein